MLVTLGLVTGSVTADVASLQTAWARAMYQVDDDARQDAMADLAERARTEAEAHPEDPGVLIWNGIILSSYAGEKGGLGALGLVKEARRSLEHSLELDPAALQGSAHTSLGSLYYKVPGWPLGFGSDKEARKHLRAALNLNPTGIDPNYFMGEFLVEQGESEAARRHLETALAAPDRPGRELADQGRRVEIRNLLARIDDETR
jgi:tetratricopeptide (TPR) repeat protein